MKYCVFNVKRKIMLQNKIVHRNLIFVLAIVACGVLGYMMYSSKVPQSAGSVAWVEDVAAVKRADDQEPIVYNFERMLDLIEQTKKELTV